MDWLNIFFGVIGLISFAFAIYTYFKTESKRSIEAAKIAMQQERARNSKYAIINLLHSVDAIVQMPKQGDISIAQMQNLARIARAQAYTLARQLETDENAMKKWKFGEVVETGPTEPEDAVEPQTNLDEQKRAQ